MDYIELENGGAKCRVSLVGAQVVGWTPECGEERLFMSATTPWGEEVHGGIPVCWPWYEKGPAAGLPMHGLARYFPWQVAEKADGLLRLSLESSAATRKIWPHDFSLGCTIAFGGNRLSVRLAAINSGNEPFEANDAFHPYLAVRDVEKCHIDCESDFVTRPAHLSRYAPDPVECRTLSGEGAIGTLRISAKGHAGWYYWNPGVDQKLATLASGDWRRFVCIEPVVKTEKYVLAPGETRTLEMALEAEPA